MHVGLDIGSVSAKLIVVLQRGTDKPILDTDNQEPLFDRIEESPKYHFILFKELKVQGDPVSAANTLLKAFIGLFPGQKSIGLQVTGSQAKLVSELLAIPFINEFKAISRGVAEIVPDAHTILEIGGDGSRFLRIDFDSDRDNVSILDYERNGECAAGTGSFIDQQANRLCFVTEEIGPLVLDAKNSAHIAGRCSVFAKSDMVHAQQRGYTPGAIFRGLCEAVVRNYKATVLRGKTLQPKIVFVGGVAANSGVVQAMRHVLDLEEKDLVIPTMHKYVAALGSALANGETSFDLATIKRLDDKDKRKVYNTSRSLKLDLSRVRFATKSLSAPNSDGRDYPLDVYLGIDIGSVSTNLVLVDKEGHVLDEVYTRTDGRPVQVVQRELLVWDKKWADKVNVIGVGTTGSGRELVGELVGADSVNDEITAHKTGAGFIACTLYDENVDTIFEIGGQDSKFISIEDGIVVDFTMNEACAAGTGSFLEEQATKLGISIKDDFANLALNSENPIKMGERCTVFMEKDVTAYMQQGIELQDVAAGLAYAVAQNYLNRVVRGRKIGDSIYFQGGTAYNKSVSAAFSTILKKPIIVPPHNGVMGAVGAALLAKEKRGTDAQPSRFRGFDLSKVKFDIRNFRCKACSNECDIQEITIDGEKTYWGDKCSERYRKKRKVDQEPVIPDLFAVYENLLLKDYAPPKGSGIKIGIPRSMYFYDRFPFWQAYFNALGAELYLSDQTNRSIIAKGRELCIAEPCFPIIVAHGHAKTLLDQEIDFIFNPIIVNSETEFKDTKSWACPWGQTLSLVLKNTLDDPVQRERLLAPVVRFNDGIDFVKKELEPVAKKLGASPGINKEAVQLAYKAQSQFDRELKETGRKNLAHLSKLGQSAVIIIGRPYNIYDFGVNMGVPRKLREDYGINVIPMDFLPFEGIDIRDIHENMFWHYGRRILQAARYVGQHKNLHIIYFTNFKCGPDSYIKHFVRDAIKAPHLTLQFDGHGNDAGTMTRCEAYLESKSLLQATFIAKTGQRCGKQPQIVVEQQI